MLSGSRIMRITTRLIFVTGFLLCCLPTRAQSNKIELLSANSLKFDKNLGVDAQRLIGDVRFRHQGALMFCDSAYLYNAHNSLDAFGHVRIVQGDTLNMNSDRLYYDGNNQYVKVRDNVTLRDRSMKLETNTLDYDRKTGTATFFDQGVITSTENDNKLISCEGIYDSRIKYFYFRDSVILLNPRYRVETDTLNYSDAREIAYFEGPTWIYSDENTIYCENGWYDTRLDISQFNENAYLDNGEQVLRGDSLWYNRNTGLGKAYENVSLADTAEGVTIRGNYGEHSDLSGQSLITGQAEMIQYERGDSLFLHGDTLRAVRDTVRGDRIYAYHNVRFFRQDIQGVADSVIFTKSDSLIRMYTEPVLWSDDLQITGDTIFIKTARGNVEFLYVFENAFMINRVDSVKYNQIKGRRLTGFFRNNDLYKVLIKGNGESLYYAAEEEKVKPDSALTASGDSLGSVVVRNYIGVNKAICSDILIYLNDNQVKRIVFLKKPDGTFYPLSKFPDDMRYYKGFNWQAERRPLNHADIFRKVLSPLQKKAEEDDQFLQPESIPEKLPTARDQKK